MMDDDTKLEELLHAEDFLNILQQLSKIFRYYLEEDKLLRNTTMVITTNDAIEHWKMLIVKQNDSLDYTLSMAYSEFEQKLKDFLYMETEMSDYEKEHPTPADEYGSTLMFAEPSPMFIVDEFLLVLSAEMQGKDRPNVVISDVINKALEMKDTLR